VEWKYFNIHKCAMPSIAPSVLRAQALASMSLYPRALIGGCSRKLTMLPSLEPLLTPADKCVSVALRFLSFLLPLSCCGVSCEFRAVIYSGMPFLVRSLRFRSES
jgi:hypothetical protein